MENRAKWIWYSGDFELYHHMLLSCRRQEKGCDYPCMWHLSAPEKSVRFQKNFVAPANTTVRFVTHSKGMVRLADRLFPVNTDIPVPAGEHNIVAELYDLEKFPSLYVNSPYLVTDETWNADPFDRQPLPAECEPAYYAPGDDPCVFPFCYAPIPLAGQEAVNGGILYDFGKENFGTVRLPAKNAEGTVLIYGESREEALDYENAILRETLTAKDNPLRPARAFRYLFVKTPDGNPLVPEAFSEYLPLKDKAYFRCDDEKIEKIWEVCAYTFHLNSREFFLDGIKRDRWVWSGDAYQSFMINRCLYDDNAVTERTIRALLGKPPYKIHINTINDYSAYLITAVWEHYYHTGKKEFLQRIYPTLKELYRFITGRLDERGYAVPRQGDWVFIDWGTLDKTGAHCFEQILLWKVYCVMAKLCEVMGEADTYTPLAEDIKAKIDRDFWDEEKGAYIDSFESGKRFVTRQTNAMAILTDFVSGKKQESIVKNVMENPDLPAVKTPYFKLYELSALCKCGKIETAQEYIRSYWGQMLDLGATSVWEEFDPAKEGTEHYEMYGSLYGKSLCHAWGSGPILLLIGYCAGVTETSVGGKTFEVRPNPGKYRHFSACAPVGGGTVTVAYENGRVTVQTDAEGGALVFGGKSYPLRPGIPCVAEQ